MRFSKNFLSALFAVGKTVTALTLLRGGTFITYNNSTNDVEVITDGSMLFNDTIVAISNSIDGLDSQIGDAEVVNTTGKIITPGFIDTHRHTWCVHFAFFFYC